MTAMGPIVDIFCAEIAPHRAIVFARAASPDPEPGWRLEGRIRGPFCRFAGTLPANSALVDAGPGSSLLARAIVPDPSLWTPELPSWYEARVECRRGQTVAFQANVRFAVRQLVGDRNGFWLSGKRFVLRGAKATSASGDLSLAEWRDAPLARIVGVDDDRQEWDSALEAGVLHIVDCSDRAIVTDEIATIASYSAVGMIVLGPVRPSLREVRTAAPNLLVALRGEPGAQDLNRAESAEVPDAWWTRTPANRDLAQTWSAIGTPVIVERGLELSVPLEAARLACDSLQATLAPWGQFAGYVV